MNKAINQDGVVIMPMEDSDGMKRFKFSWVVAGTNQQGKPVPKVRTKTMKFTNSQCAKEWAALKVKDMERESPVWA
jgi:hypothetical protein